MFAVPCGKSVILWRRNPDNPQEIGSSLKYLRKHKDTVSSVAFSPDGTSLATASWDKTIRIWKEVSWSTNELKYEVVRNASTGAISTLSYSQDGEHIAIGGYDNMITVYNVNNLKRLYNLIGHSEFVSSVVYVNKWIVSGSGDGTVKMWDIDSRSQIHTFEGHEKSVLCICSLNDEVVISGSEDCSVMFWSLTDKKHLRTLKEHSKSVESVSCCADGTLLATGSSDRTVKVWRISDGSCIHTLKGHLQRVTSVSFSPNGSCIVSGSRDKSIRMWSIGDGSCVRVMEGHEKWITCVGFSPDGGVIGSGSFDKSVGVWKASSMEHFCTLDGHSSRVTYAIFCNNGELLISAMENGNVVIWNVEEKSVIRIIEAHSSVIRTVSCSSDGELLCSGSDGKTVKVWGMLDDDECITALQHDSGVTSLSWSPDVRLLAVGNSNGSVYVWRTDNWELLWRRDRQSTSVVSLLFSSSGNEVCSCTDIGEVNVWLTNNGNDVYLSNGFEGIIMSFDVSFQSHLLCFGSSDGHVEIRDMSSMNCIVSVTRRLSPVIKCLFSMDGSRISCLHEDSTLLVGNCEGSFEEISGVKDVCRTPDDRMVVVKENGVVLGCMSFDLQLAKSELSVDDIDECLRVSLLSNSPEDISLWEVFFSRLYSELKGSKKNSKLVLEGLRHINEHGHETWQSSIEATSSSLESAISSSIEKEDVRKQQYVSEKSRFLSMADEYIIRKKCVVCGHRGMFIHKKVDVNVFGRSYRIHVKCLDSLKEKEKAVEDEEVQETIRQKEAKSHVSSLRRQLDNMKKIWEIIDKFSGKIIQSSSIVSNVQSLRQQGSEPLYEIINKPLFSPSRETFSSSPYTSWSVEAVVEWLVFLGLEKYNSSVRNCVLDGSMLSDIVQDVNSAATALEMGNPYHIRSLVVGIERLMEGRSPLNYCSVGSVGRWLERLGLSEYINCFLSNAINGNLLSELTFEDLREIGVKNRFHCRKILRYVDLLGVMDSSLFGAVSSSGIENCVLAYWDVSNVSRFMEQFLRFQRYGELLSENSVDGVMLLEMNVEDLIEIGISNRLHRQSVMSVVSALSSHLPFAGKVSLSVDDVCNKLEAVGLDTFIPFFRENGLFGGVLLDMSSTEIEVCCEEVGVSKLLTKRLVLFVETLQQTGTEEVGMRRWSVNDVQSWLVWLGLEEYSELFRENCVDGPLITELSVEELEEELGITDQCHLRSLLAALEFWNDKDPVFCDGLELISWSVSQVCDWLAGNGLTPVAEEFKSRGIHGYMLMDLTESDMDELELANNMFHRTRLVREVSKMEGSSMSRKSDGREKMEENRVNHLKSIDEARKRREKKRLESREQLETERQNRKTKVLEEFKTLREMKVSKNQRKKMNDKQVVSQEEETNIISSEQFINRYEGECVVEGGLHILWFGKQINTNKKVFIKVFDEMEHFERELEGLRECRNKNYVVGLEDVFESVDGRGVMEYLEPGYCKDKNGTFPLHILVLERGKVNLRNVIRRHLELPAIRFLFFQLAKCVEEVHKCRRVHGDIKPDNFVIFGEVGMEFWKLIDFENCSLFGEEVIGSVQYSPYYSSPEIIRHVKRLQEKSSDDIIVSQPTSDIWSLGVVFLEVFMGHPLFSNEEEAMRILCSDKLLINHIPFEMIEDRQARDLIRDKMLQIDPSKRISIHSVVNNAFIRGGMNTKEQKEICRSQIGVLENVERKMDSIGTVLQSVLSVTTESLDRMKEGSVLCDIYMEEMGEMSRLVMMKEYEMSDGNIMEAFRLFTGKKYCLYIEIGCERGGNVPIRNVESLTLENPRIFHVKKERSGICDVAVSSNEEFSKQLDVKVDWEYVNARSGTFRVSSEWNLSYESENYWTTKTEKNSVISVDLSVVLVHEEMSRPICITRNIWLRMEDLNVSTKIERRGKEIKRRIPGWAKTLVRGLAFGIVI